MDEQNLTPGQVQDHCSDEGGGPDVGQLLALGGGKYLWAGEITHARWSEAGSEAQELGDDFGWWLILYENEGKDSTVLGKFVGPEIGLLLIQEMSSALTKTALTPTR